MNLKRNKKRKKSSAVESLASDASFLKTYTRHLYQEGILIVSLFCAAFLFVALMTYHRVDSSWSHMTADPVVLNAAGRLGAWLSDGFLYLFGYCAYIFPLMLCVSIWKSYRLRCDRSIRAEHRSYLRLLRLSGFASLLVTLCSLVTLHLQKPFSPLPYDTGGMIGASVGHRLLHELNPVGANLFLFSLLLLGTTFFSGLSWFRVFERIGGLTMQCIQGLFGGVQRLFEQGAAILKKSRDRSLAIEPKIAEVPVVSRRIAIEKVKPEQLADVIEELKRSSPNSSPSVNPSVNPSSNSSSKPSITPPAKPELNTTMSENLHRARDVKLPGLNLLDAPHEEQKNTFDRQKLEEKSLEVELRLADFGVQAKVVAVHPGPVVTRYELSLAAGTKASKITSLAKDLARSLSVISVRVVEVIPGKSVIGLELPNAFRETVMLQEVLASKSYQHARSPLSLALGKDISGNPVVVDLAKMPHLLVAGTTGSGKSVCLNAMLLSLLYKSTPDQLRLILIDPKMLELSVYDGVPHLLAPVVTDMKDASTALRWCVVEMERRYRLMASLGVRNIAGYNQKVKEAEKSGKPLYDPLVQDAEQKPILTTLPQIVVLADEFADMMVVVGKKVETLIARLAQKARAAGIHLILATQRPSVDVITGLIKANIPTRIAFQVSSKIDSRTILDQQGAEQLLGNGDMLYLPPGSGVPVRIHGAYVHDDEVHRVVDALKQAGGPSYVEDILNEGGVGQDASGYMQAAFGVSEDDGEKDPLYDQAVDAVARSRRVSISSIQRRFKIGYNRAARIVEAMEVAGVVSQMETNGNRDVLIPAPQEH